MLSITQNKSKSTQLLCLLISVCLFHPSHALSPQHQPSSEINRRTVVGGLLSTSILQLPIPSISNAAPPPMSLTPATAGIQGAGGSITRVEGVGGGFDIRTSTTVIGKDVIYPGSMAGLWKCRRVVTSIEGDSGQAELAWKNLGGTGSIKNIEIYDTRFLLPAEELNIQNAYSFEGEDFKGVVLDRGFEMASRIQAPVQWNIEMPDGLSYVRDGSESGVEVAVVQRKLEVPNAKGFGFNELYRVTSSAGGIFGDIKVQRAVRVQRRYRRTFDEEGNRIVEGLEIMKTYRELDGIAGVEMPTSTTKSQLKFRMG